MNGIPVQVIQLLKRSGIKGITQVRCKVMEGPESGKVLIRNVAGPIKLGDILILTEIDMESAGNISTKRRK